MLKGPGPGDVAPHAVELGENVVPQRWTITMLDDELRYYDRPTAAPASLLHEDLVTWVVTPINRHVQLNREI